MRIQEFVTKEIGWIPLLFIIAALFNFTMGASIGVWMTWEPSMWGQLGPIHGWLNPFGWLTVLIYGMTYAVLSLMASLRIVFRSVAVLHWMVAEVGVLDTAFTTSNPSSVFHTVGVALLWIAPLLFLFTIVSSAVVGRKKGRIDWPVSEAEPASQVQKNNILSFLGRRPEYKATDAVAQRGTEVSLLFLLAAMGIWTWDSVRGTAVSPVINDTSAVLVYYGWIMGTVLAVAIHLVPRYGARPFSHTAWLQVLQAVWLCCLLLYVMPEAWGTWSRTVGELGMGLALVGFSVTWLWSLPKMIYRFPLHINLAWALSWGSALVLGILLVCRTNVLGLYNLHLLFLAWLTTLIYAVGYTLFPLLLRRHIRSPRQAVVQVCCSWLGSVWMVAWFAGWTAGIPYGLEWFGISGTVVGCSFLWFTAFWLTGTSTD